MSKGCEEVRHSLGVYVLGAIDPAERSIVDAHLAACPVCRDELAGLAGLPALLGRVNQVQLAELVEPPADLLEPLLARAATENAERRRRPWRGRRGKRWSTPTLIAAATLVVGLLSGGLAGAWLHESQDRDPAPARSWSASGEQYTVAKGPLTVRLTVLGRPSGTVAQMKLSGVGRGHRCRLEAVDRLGRRDSMGSWTIAYGGDYEFVGSTMFARAAVIRFQIVDDESGQVLLEIPT